jgi:amidohydrolase
MTTTFYDEAAALRSEMVARRRDLHRHPELAFQEARTAGIVAAALNELGLEVRTGVGKTGVVGLLEGGADGPTVLVRADMDALPIQEANETDYVSETPGVMHACGHDGHVTIGLTVARLLAGRRADIKGRVKFVFQPAEETGEGARAMIADGVLDDPRPAVSLGLHLWNEMPVGTVGVTRGPSMAAADDWSCRVTGYGGHGAIPEKARDPIVTAAQIVGALQTIVSRSVSPLDAAVISVTAIHGGEAFNVIPDSVDLRGTARTYTEAVKELVHRRMEEVCTGVAAALGCQAEVDIQSIIPAVVNDPAVADRVAEVAARTVGEEGVRMDVRSTVSEDVGLLMADIPGCFFFVGSANAARGLDYPHHNPRFDIDEDALPIGAAILADAVASYVLGEG